MRRRVDATALARRGVFTFETFQPVVSAQAEWLVEGVIPDKSVNLLVGNSGLGKTPLGITLGISVAAGVPFFGHEVLSSSDPGGPPSPELPAPVPHASPGASRTWAGTGGENSQMY